MASKPSDPGGDTLPLLEPGHTFGSITDKISSIVLTGRTPLFWYITFGVGFILVLVLLFCITALVSSASVFWRDDSCRRGVGAIVNFVWWIGIGHAGTLISAILLLLRPEMAPVDQPIRRSHDIVRRRLRRESFR
jgi:molybdopterin-containing oxidoreductase family membrane subunit